MMPKKTAIIYHYIAHYRLPVFRQLMKTNGIEYTLISASESGNDIRTIDVELAKMKIRDGGLRWLMVKNHWLSENRFLWQSGLFSVLWRNNYDSVIFLGNIYYITTWLAIPLLRLKGAKIYLWCHGVTSDERGLKWQLRKLFYNLTDGVMLYGNKAKDVMVRNGFDAKKLHVIYNSLDYANQLIYRQKLEPKTILRVREELFKYPELPLIVFVGRLSSVKKLDMIVEASRILHEQAFKINTLFVGDGSEKEKLDSLIKSYKLDDYFNLYGSCYGEALLSGLIGSADICVSPGEVGLTAITALGYGTPVITHGDFNHQMPEFEAITPGLNGEFFERNSTVDLADKIRQWINDHKDVPTEIVKGNCYKVVDELYNPVNQANLINKIILGNG